MENDKKRQLTERTKKLVELSKKAPFFTSYVSLFYETTNILFSELNYKLLFFSLVSDEFGYPKIYNFEEKELITGNGACKCYSKSQILEFSKILNSFDEPILISKQRIENWFLQSGEDFPEFMPEAALVSPIKDRFDEKLGFMFLCSQDKLDADDLGFFSNIASVVGTGLSVLEKLENGDSYLDDHVAHSPIGFLKISHDFKILSVNDSFARIFGFENANRFLSDDNQPFVKRLERSRNFINALVKLKNSENFTVVREMLARDKYKNKIWLEIHGRYHVSETPSKTFFEVLVLDITDYKKLEREFSNLLILQDSLFNLSRDGIVLEDENGTILGINNVLTGRYGKSADFLIGKHISVLGGDKRTILENIRTLQDGKPHVQTIEHLTPDGNRYFYELSEQLVTFPDGNKRIVSYSRDITKEIGFEQKIIKLKSDLQSYKEFQNLFITAVSDKKDEVLKIIEDYLGFIDKFSKKENARETIDKLNLFKEEILKIKITLDLLAAVNSAFLDNNFYNKTSFELSDVLQNEFFPEIKNYLKLHGTIINSNITKVKHKHHLDTEKEVLINLLKLIFASLVKNKTYNRIDFYLKEGKQDRSIIEIVLSEDVLSTELLGKIFTSPSTQQEYYVYIPKLFSLAENFGLIFQSGEKTKIKLIII